MRQAGVLAAAINYALDNNQQRLVIDHQNARLLQTELENLDELTVESANTNMLYINFASDTVGKKVAQQLKNKNILISAGKRVRLVTHLDINENDITRSILELKSALLKALLA